MQVRLWHERVDALWSFGLRRLKSTTVEAFDIRIGKGRSRGSVMMALAVFATLLGGCGDDE